ncbi:hypothetical protein G9A89_005583 [Geosiphon pyriformis]|nr:hypothetical protein G9A89_005583 [Geosiphon pyriformis]
MGDYLYLPQQSEKHFAVHNRNDLDFIELNLLSFCLICFSLEKQFNRQFQDFWNWFLNKHSAETYIAYTTYYFDQTYFEDNFEERNNSINQLLYFTTFTQQSPDFEYLNYQIHIWVAAYQSTITPLETEEESYQTALIFDLFLNFMQTNILAALQGIQTALGQKNNTPLPLFKSNAQDPIEWLDDFERATTANQYDDEYKFQITPANIEENITSFTTWFENKFRTPILISKWHIELKKRIQGPSEVVTKYTKAIRKLIKHVDSGRNWTKEQKIHSFTKGLRTDLSYAFWPLLALKDNPTMDIAIELVQRIEDNQRMHLGSTLPVFAPTSQMAATSFAA